MALPETFGKYFLTEKIATGGMAEIYRGKLFGPGGFEKQLVIKRVLPRFSESPHLLRMFFEEAKTQVSLSHGNLVSVLDFGRDDGSCSVTGGSGCEASVTIRWMRERASSRCEAGIMGGSPSPEPTYAPRPALQR